MQISPVVRMEAENISVPRERGQYTCQKKEFFARRFPNPAKFSIRAAVSFGRRVCLEKIYLFSTQICIPPPKQTTVCADQRFPYFPLCVGFFPFNLQIRSDLYFVVVSIRQILMLKFCLNFSVGF
jgi:hypothetical protein